MVAVEQRLAEDRFELLDAPRQRRVAERKVGRGGLDRTQPGNCGKGFETGQGRQAAHKAS